MGEVATIVTPDTILRWHRQLIARNGRRPRALAVEASLPKSDSWLCGWRRSIPPGATHGFKGAEGRGPSRRSIDDRAERNHQGLGNRLIERAGRVQAEGRIRRRARLGGLLNYSERAA